MDYTVESLTPVMAHIAKNITKVNEGQTKHMVSWCKSLLLSNSRSGIVAYLSIKTPIAQLKSTLDLHFSLFQAVKGKYSTSKQMRIAAIPQLRSSLVKDLAKLAH